MCLPSLVTDADAIFAVGIIKKVTGEKRQGVVSTPLGVRGLKIIIDIWFNY